MREEIKLLIEENKNLIYSIASKYSRYYSIEDLFQVGVIGLINAYKHYDKGKNSKFTTYAFQYIRGEIIDYIKKDRTIKISENYLKIYSSYEKVKAYLTSKNDKEPTLNEISSLIGIDENLLIEAINNSQLSLSLDECLSDESETSYLQTVGIDYRSEIDELIDLKSALLKLTKEEQDLIDYRYYQGLTQDETARMLGMSQVQVSRNEKLVLSKIRKSIVS